MSRFPVRITTCIAFLVVTTVMPAAAQRGGGNDPFFTSPPGAIPKPAINALVSPNFGDRAFGSVIDSVVMHTTEVSLDGTLAIFQDTDSQVSAHFVIAPNGDLYQMVDTRDRAWHATYYNSRSIGIEMVGYAHQPSTWNENNLATLVELLAWITTAYPDIPLERQDGDAYDFPGDQFNLPGIVAHGQIQPWNRTDPGPYFPWDDVLTGVESRLRVIPEPAGALSVFLWLAARPLRRVTGRARR